MLELPIQSISRVALHRRAIGLLGRGMLAASLVLFSGIANPALAQLQTQVPPPRPATDDVQTPHPPGPEGVPAEFAGRGCRFFVNEDGQGESAHISVKTRQENGGVISYALFHQTMSSYWGNNISAVQCDHHCSAVLYDEEHLAGPEIFTPDGQGGFMSMANSAANNRASSLSIFCAR